MKKSVKDLAPLPIDREPADPTALGEVVPQYFIEDLASIKVGPRKWLVKGVIPGGNSFTGICGDSNCGKTFMLFAIMLSYAMGLSSWQGQKIYGKPEDRGAVVYFYSEGLDDVLYRVYGWLQVHGYKIEDLQGKFFPLDYNEFVDDDSIKDPSLSDPQTCKRIKASLEDLCKRYHTHIDLIGIDTLNGWMGGDEDSAKDMRLFFQNLTTYMAAPFNASVVIVHHTGLIAEDKKNAKEIRPRGSSAFRARLDSLIMCMGNIFEKGLEVFTNKLRPGKRGLDLYIKAIEVVIDCVPLDDEGEPTTTLVVDDSLTSDEVKKIFDKANTPEKNNVTAKTHEDFSALNMAMNKKELPYTLLEEEGYKDEEGYPHNVYALKREDIKAWLRDFYFRKKYEESGYKESRIKQELSKEMAIYEADKLSSRFIGRLYKAGIVKFDSLENWTRMYTQDRYGDGGINTITWQVIHVGFCPKEKED